MTGKIYSQIVSFIWSIADDELRDVFVRGKYRDVILPMTVIRRLDAVLEDTKEEVREMKKRLDEMEVLNQTEALCSVSGQAFYNDSPFILKDLTSRTKKQQLEADFLAYLDGFSPNIQEILEKFRFREQIKVMTDADVLGDVIEKFVSPRINISPNPVLDDNGDILLPGLDNHTMGTVFEELIRKFNEENNEEAGEHFTPRDAVRLMTDLMFKPISDKISDGTYLCYDGACGTGGMLTIADERLKELGKKNNKNFSIHLYGQESQPETYAIAKADMILKGDGSQANNISYGSTLSVDANPTTEFDFMISNPPYGKSWSSDAKKMGGRNKLTDSRFVVSFGDEEEFRMVPSQSDGQMLFLANNIAKMKHSTPLGSRIVQVHNGSSLFTGNAGSGESNLRRYIIENDYLEAIVALPENMFYNTGIATYVWVLSNRKEDRRKGKIQLIDATSFKKPLRKNLGNKNCEISEELREEIMKMYLDFEENEFSKIFENEEFGYYEVTVERPLRLKVNLSQENLDRLEESLKKNDKYIFDLVLKLKEKERKEEYLDYNLYIEKLENLAEEKDEKFLARHRKLIQDNLTIADEKAKKLIKSSKKKGKEDPSYGVFREDNLYIEYEQDTELRDTERIPLNYNGGIEGFFKEEVIPYVGDAWIDESRTRIGYEISFTKYFYKPVKLRSLEEIVEDIKALEEETDGLLDEIIGG